MTEMLCFHCGVKPRIPDRRRLLRPHCGDEECAKATRRGVNRSEQLHWPEITGEDTADFSAHNIKTRSVGKIGMAEPRGSMTGGWYFD